MQKMSNFFSGVISNADLSRSGVEPPTGTIHPRKGRGAESGKRESKIHFVDAFPDLELWEGI